VTLASVSGPRPRGRLYAGTSGFAYSGWAPLFYPTGTRGVRLLPAYAARLSAVELNNTFYRHPRQAQVEAWLRATPAAFRFSVIAQRGGSIRALHADTEGTVGWLTAPYRMFGERLGSVLVRVADRMQRDDDALARLLDAWPAELPLAVELRHPTWEDDEVHDLLRSHRVVLSTTDLDGAPGPPDIRRTGGFLYLRLRRASYSDTALESWAARIEPFLDDGIDAHVFFRHDETGASAIRAMRLAQLAGQAQLAAQAPLAGQAPPSGQATGSG
jgi:uncharacterized protein YecE (DUF72 family)